ncbi:MAG: hypothetical protein K2H15_04940 [Muribaculaceae bacterium]|nr:hypothetical protein [Muribaculaceae bacterium]
MKLYKHIYYLPIMLLMTLSTGCSDSDWTPGPVDKETGVSAYFDTPSKTEYIFGSDYSPEDMVIKVDVSREVTEGEVSIPVTMTASAPGFTSPDVVTFADGEAHTSFEINCSGIENKVYFDVEVGLDPSQTNIYGVGLPTVGYKVIKADWLLVSDNVKYSYKDTSSVAVWPSTTGELYQLDGTNIFRLTDFWGSGLNTRFECNTPNTTAFVPLSNFNREYIDDEDDLADGAYYFYDDEESEYPNWVPGDAEGYPTIEWAMFYANEDDGELCMVSNPNTLYGYATFLAYLDLDDGSGNWYYFSITWNLKYNPFN